MLAPSYIYVGGGTFVSSGVGASGDGRGRSIAKELNHSSARDVVRARECPDPVDDDPRGTRRSSRRDTPGRARVPTRSPSSCRSMDPRGHTVEATSRTKTALLTSD